MGFLDKLLGTARAPRARRGSAFPAADISRLTASFEYQPGTINRWLRYELKTLRNRSRALARGDSYGAKFIESCVENIAGPNGFMLTAKLKFSTGRLNTKANEQIEDAYCQWSKPGGAEITGKFSLPEYDRLKIRCMARDGEALARKVYTPLGIQYQMLDIERLDEQRNENLPDGAIKMGVEVDLLGRPRAYWLLKENPGELGEWSRGRERQYERVPAEQIEHNFIADWPEQVRGVPWMHAAILRLWNLGEFERAALINARVGATKLAVLQSPNGEPPETLATGQESAGNMLSDAEPGQYWTLPQGYELKDYNPSFPDAAMEPFMRTALRGVASALGVAYHSLANDPSSVNYSTARVALLEERDMWKAAQKWYIDHVCYPRVREWLQVQAMTAGWPASYAGQIDALRFQGKTWGWVDPEKEITSKVLALGAQLTSRQRIAAEQGEDWEDIAEELAEEQAIAADLGVVLQIQKPGMAQTAPEDPAAKPAASSSSSSETPAENAGETPAQETPAEDAAGRSKVARLLRP